MSHSPLGREIFRTYDEHGPIQVFDDGNRRYLSFGEGEEQSCVALHEPQILQHDYTRAMLLPLLFAEPKRALLLGLGGGALASCLWHALPELTIQAIELRRAVIKVAYRYFDLPRDPRLEVVNDDAAEFLERAPAGRVDLLCSDLYGGEGMALQLFQPWFMEACTRALSPDGWLVLNCWNEHRAAHETLASLYDLFATVQACNTPGGNWIVFASRRPARVSARAVEENAREWARRLGFSLAQPLHQLQTLGATEPACTLS